MTTDARLGTLEGRVDEHSAAIADLRDGQREIRNALASMNSQLNSRIDRVFLAILGIGAAQIALLITLILRN